MRTQTIRRIPLMVALTTLMALMFASQAGAAPEDRGRYIVVFEDATEHPGRVAQRHAANRGAGITHVYRHALKGYAAKIPAGELQAVRQDPNVASIESDGPGGIAAQETPTGIDRTFASANEALAINEEADYVADVDVAVLDTGVDAEHPDLNVVGEINCRGEEPPTCVEGSGSSGGHGTHVAGTIGAIDNGIGVVGVAPGARIWSVQVLDAETGTGQLSEFIAGIDWITGTREDEDPKNDIEVANASLRYWCCTSSEAFDKAIAASQNAGVVHVVAAGNETQTVKYVPGNHPDVITVSALADYDGKPGGEAVPTCMNHGVDDKLASFSNFGSVIDIAAPGVCIYSTWSGIFDYNTLSGTSMASPHVAGAAAILAANDPPTSRADVEAIRDTLVEEGNEDWEDASTDGVKEPLLDVSDEAVFSPLLDPPTFGFSFGETGTGNGQLDHPGGMATDSEGNLWVPDFNNDRVQRFTSTGEYLSQFGETGSGNGQLDRPAVLAIDSQGDIWVTDFENDRVQQFNAKGEYLSQFGEFGTGNGQLNGPIGVAIDSQGDIWVADGFNDRVQQFSPTGEYLSQFGQTGTGNGQLAVPMEIDFDSQGDLWVADSGNDRVQQFSPTGEYLSQFGETGSGNGQLERPLGIKIDSEDRIWVTDSGNDRVQQFNPIGEYLSQFGETGSGNGQLDEPGGMTIDGQGDIWIGDIINDRVQEWVFPPPMFKAETYPATIQGKGSLGFSSPSHGTVECIAAVLAGQLTGPNVELVLDPGYPFGCTSFAGGASFPSTADAHSCHYTLGAQRPAPPYSADLGVVCDEVGDTIEYRAYADQKQLEENKPICVTKVGPQLGAEAVSLFNFGKGTARMLGLEFEAKGMTHEVSGACVAEGPKIYNDGVAIGHSQLMGKDENGDQVGVYVAEH